MDESRIGQYSISVTTYPIMALVVVYWSLNIFCDFTNKRCGCGLVIESGITQSKKGLTNDS